MLVFLGGNHHSRSNLSYDKGKHWLLYDFLKLFFKQQVFTSEKVKKQLIRKILDQFRSTSSHKSNWEEANNISCLGPLWRWFILASNSRQFPIFCFVLFYRFKYSYTANKPATSTHLQLYSYADFDLYMLKTFCLGRLSFFRQELTLQ